MKMKIFIVLLLVAVMCLPLVACDSGNIPNESNGAANTTTTTKTPDKPISDGSANAPHTHSFGDWTISVPATCNSEGVRERLCSCGEKETESVPAAHNYTNATCETAKTCATCGAVDGVPQGHKWQSATCEKAKTCSVCHSTDGDPLGHTTDSGLCDNCGKLIGSDAAAVRNIIEIYEVKVMDIDSAEGVDLGISFSNKSNKTIKYIHFYVTPYNAVGDVMECEIRGYSRYDAYVTGPLEPGYEGFWRYGSWVYPGHNWGECWYNGSIRYIELDTVKIEYTDGTVLYLSGDTLELAFTDYPIKTQVTQIGWKTGFSYNDPSKYYDFSLMLLNDDSVSLPADAIVDVRIVNDDGKTVFSKSYTITPDDYEDLTTSLGTDQVAYFKVYDSEIKPGSSRYGKVYYHIYSADGSFDFEEKYYRTYDLPQ